MSRVPPQGDISRERACSRLLGHHEDGSENVCGKAPVVHIAWRFDPDGVVQGWVCEEHEKEAFTRWHPADHHPVGESCGMPGTLWFHGEPSECRFDDLPTAEPERTVAVAEATA